jgi:hypothetical protein
MTRYTAPDTVLASTGVVVAGYGEAEIFPAYRQIDIFGHLGSELYVRDSRKFEITHSESAMIQPLAQTSMIDVFTDGFGSSLWSIIRDSSKSTLDKVFSELASNGVVVPPQVSNDISSRLHDDFVQDWMRRNWRKNLGPLINVIATLSVEEMAHLAETLLVLESLKERVTSSSETVGGPIDVAAITKSEGLIWVKRKHFFDLALNMRYAQRLQRSMAN